MELKSKQPLMHRECCVENIVFVDGLSRSGKFMLAPIVASLDNVEQFYGLSLRDFYNIKESALDQIQDPSGDSVDDFNATLRGLKKNLILLDEFILNNKHDEYFTKE